MKKLYIGNLPYSANEADLAELFSQYGEVVNTVVIQDRATGRSKGFGFIEFSDDAAAEAALELDGQDYQGRNLKVNVAREKERSGGSGGGSRGGKRW